MAWNKVTFQIQKPQLMVVIKGGIYKPRLKCSLETLLVAPKPLALSTNHDYLALHVRTSLQAAAEIQSK